LSIFLTGDLDVEEIKRAICYIKGVEDVHGYHVWSISPSEHALMTHVRFSNTHSKKHFYGKFEFLMKKYKIKFYTVQLEETAVQIKD
jgi:Co/Zn/Cd efflux system component